MVRTCIIATASYGSPMADEVQFLRWYRENVVKRTSRGQTALNIFERFYYSFSPAVARWIEKSTLRRKLARIFVADPIVDIFMLFAFFSETGKRQFRKIDAKTLPLELGLFLRGLGGLLYSGGWIAWNSFLVASLFLGTPMLYFAILCWLPMCIGLLSMLIGNVLHHNIDFNSFR